MGEIQPFIRLDSAIHSSMDEIQPFIRLRGDRAASCDSVSDPLCHIAVSRLLLTRSYTIFVIVSPRTRLSPMFEIKDLPFVLDLI
eukprot:g41021.t1